MRVVNILALTDTQLLQAAQLLRDALSYLAAMDAEDVVGWCGSNFLLRILRRT